MTKLKCVEFKSYHFSFNNYFLSPTLLFTFVVKCLIFNFW